MVDGGCKLFPVQTFIPLEGKTPGGEHCVVWRVCAIHSYTPAQAGSPGSRGASAASEAKVRMWSPDVSLCVGLPPALFFPVTCLSVKNPSSFSSGKNRMVMSILQNPPQF